MKASVIVIMVAIAFVAGCEQGGIIETSSGIPSEAVIEKDAAGTGSQEGIILLQGMVAEPGGFNEMSLVSGEIGYSITSPNGEMAQCTYVSFSLSASGEVMPMENDLNQKNSWAFGGESSESVCTGYSGVMIEMVYSLQGRSDGAALHVQLLVGQDLITLDHMWLALPSIDPAND